LTTPTPIADISREIGEDVQLGRARRAELEEESADVE
jgi:hypothetical protein